MIVRFLMDLIPSRYTSHVGVGFLAWVGQSKYYIQEAGDDFGPLVSGDKKLRDVFVNYFPKKSQVFWSQEV